MVDKQIGKLEFRPGESILYVFLISLSIFILGVQIGIKQGRTLQLEEIRIEYDYNFPD